MQSFCQSIFWKCLSIYCLSMATICFAAVETNVVDLKTTTKATAPIAKKKPKNTTLFGETRVDNYAWMRDSSWPEAVKDKNILGYIHEENMYAESILTPLKSLEVKLCHEMKDRFAEEDSSYPIKEDQYFYYERFEKGKDFAIHCRKREESNQEEIILDENALAQGHKNFSLGSMKVSPDHTFVAYSDDTSGREIYTIQVKDLKTGKLLVDKVDNTFSNPLEDLPPQIVWHKKLCGFFYVSQNKKQRSNKIFFHTLGEPQSKDQLVFEENDQKYGVNIRISADQQYLIIESSDFNSNCTLYLDLTSKCLIPKLVLPRNNNVDHKVNLIAGYFYFSINDKNKAYRLVRTPVNQTAPEHWEEIIYPSDTSSLTDFYLYKDHLVIRQKEMGIPHIKVMAFDNLDKVEDISFKDEAYEAKIKSTTIDDPYLRIEYSSLTTPDTVYEYEFKTKELHKRKVRYVGKNFDSTNYQVDRLQVPSQDGTLVPITLIYRKDKKLSDGNPLVLYGYGASAVATDVSFSSNLFSLVDRGFVFALAHTRGGDELGYTWYKDGKLLNKKHSFEDFIACSEHLIEKKYTSKKAIVAMGESAGGLLVGACINERPDLYKAAGAFVPFVDTLNDMLDEQLPLTTGYYSEIGNPQEEQYYRSIRAYSPYDNIKAQEYPHLYVTTGLKDVRVPYWGPLKWVAKLRALKTDNHYILLDVQINEGHSGAAGRTAYITKEMSKFYAFLLHVFGMSAD